MVKEQKNIRGKPTKVDLGGVEMFKRLTLHYQQWNRWQKRCMNSRFHKILVLLKLKRSPSFEMMKVGERIAANTVSIFGKLTKAMDSSAKSFAEFNDIVCATLEKGVKGDEQFK